jgi:lipopolysaccharide export system protein LptC
MAGPDNRYSLFIGWAKVTLPLAALALLSTMFLFARRSDDAERIPFSEIAAIAREPRISNPTLAGIADDGSIVSLLAQEIRPVAGQPDRFAVTGVNLGLVSADGADITVTAGSGQIDGAGRTALFSDLVRVTTSTGFAVETTGLRADLRAGTLDTVGALAGQAPFGRLDAGSLSIAANPDGTGTRLLFQDGVRLLYEPQS